MVDYIKIGQIVNTHGRLGELKIYPLTDNPLRFKELKQYLLMKIVIPLLKSVYIDKWCFYIWKVSPICIPPKT